MTPRLEGRHPTHIAISAANLSAVVAGLLALSPHLGGGTLPAASAQIITLAGTGTAGTRATMGQR